MDGQQTKRVDFAAIPQTAIKVVTSPVSFFRDMQKTGGFIEPLVFMVVMGVLSAIIQTVLTIPQLMNVKGGVTAGAASIIIMPIAIVIFGFIAAGIAFVIWKIIGSQESFETAYRCVAYAGAISPITTILGIVPYLGSVLGILIWTYFIVIASVEVHKIPAKKAWTVFGIIAVIFVLLSLRVQFAARKLESDLGQFQKKIEEATTQMQKSAEESKKAAEEAGKAASNMSEEMQKQMERQAAEMKKTAEELQRQAEEMKKHNSR
ncbi:MAG: hypothetical protein CVV37_06810 [Nitrospira bacterium HGW-Nitrospira-1]|nr:MAG: hypothetical protein CVV37_06810 [Nitrospira bacterium HGW-Nitrospira-1]